MIPYIAIREIFIHKQLLIAIFKIPYKLDKMDVVDVSYLLHLPSVERDQNVCYFQKIFNPAGFLGTKDFMLCWLLVFGRGIP